MTLPSYVSNIGNHSQHCPSEEHAALITGAKTFCLQMSFVSNSGAALVIAHNMLSINTRSSLETVSILISYSQKTLKKERNWNTLESK